MLRSAGGLPVIAWVGDPDAAAARALGVGAELSVVAELGDALAGRTPETAGVCVDRAHRSAAFAAAELNDGLARAVGFADTLAFAGGLPGPFGACFRVGGIVGAIRETAGEEYLPIDAAILGSGSEAAAALAALTQLRVTKLVAYVEPRDATTGAVAHRLGIELITRPIASFAGEERLVYSCDGATSLDSASLALPDEIDRHTARAQLKTLTSREFSLEELGA